MKKLIFLFLILWLTISCNQNDKISLIPVQEDENFGYIDIEGKYIITPQFSEANIFHEGLALVKTSGGNQKYGFIDLNGKFIISPNYISATSFKDGVAWVVSENGPPTAIDKNGEIIFVLQEAEIVHPFNENLAGFAAVRNDNSEYIYGFIDKKGKIIINPQFKSIGVFSEGKCAVTNEEGKVGYIDKDGKIIINYQFSIGYPFKNNKAIVLFEGKYGLIDDAGKYLINPQFDDMEFDGDKYLVLKDDKYGWVDSDGKILINPQFEAAEKFNNNKIAPVKSGSKFGYIDLEGKYIINPQFDHAYPFNNGMALFFSNEKLGFIDLDGKYKINPQFKHVSYDYFNNVRNKSFYEAVTSDFFNMTPILNRINILSPEGLTLSSKLTDVIKKLKVSENEFQKYSSEHKLISGEHITNDADLDFYVIADAFMEIPDGWYSRSVFNLNSKIKNLAYLINLKQKGWGKASFLQKEFEKRLTGYKFDHINSDKYSKEYLYRNKNQLIKTMIRSNESQLLILFSESSLDDYNLLGNNSQYAEEVSPVTKIPSKSIEVDTPSFEAYESDY